MKTKQTLQFIGHIILALFTTVAFLLIAGKILGY